MPEIEDMPQIIGAAYPTLSPGVATAPNLIAQLIGQAQAQLRPPRRNALAEILPIILSAGLGGGLGGRMGFGSALEGVGTAFQKRRELEETRRTQGTAVLTNLLTRLDKERSEARLEQGERWREVRDTIGKVSQRAETVQANPNVEPEQMGESIRAFGEAMILAGNFTDAEKQSIRQATDQLARTPTKVKRPLPLLVGPEGEIASAKRPNIGEPSRLNMLDASQMMGQLEQQPPVPTGYTRYEPEEVARGEKEAGRREKVAAAKAAREERPPSQAEVEYDILARSLYGMSFDKLTPQQQQNVLNERKQLGQSEEVRLSPEAVDMLARQFAITGQLPTLGMGKTSTLLRTQIIDHAAKNYPSADLASNRAAYEANKVSLTALQKNRDAVVSFENTATKNLDQFLATAKNIVDTNAPWVNAPLRSVATGALGSQDVAAFEAARRVAVNEIAKVTSNPNLTGQLSDAARKEVESFIPANASLKQIYAVANILKADMKNRHVALDEQIDAIRKRIVGAGLVPEDSKTEAPEGTLVTNSKGERLVKRNGKWVKP